VPARYDQVWVDGLVSSSASAPEKGYGAVRVLYVITDIEGDAGKAAFHLDIDAGRAVGGATGKPSRAEAADVTVTAKEAIFLAVWSGARSRDAVFMAGDFKVEGAYERWIDELVPTFEAPAWSAAWLNVTS